jgi:tyrocidine synthetase-3
MLKNRIFSSKAAFAANEYGKEREYWTKKFSGEFKKSNFPYDYNYVASTSIKNKQDSINFRFSHQSFLKLMELRSGLDHRLYMVLAAGLVVLLYKYTGNNDITIGAPIFKQESGENFINTVLALRNRIDDRTTFIELLLNRVRPTIVEANENQNYPIETLLFQLNIPFSESEFPLFETAILLQNIHDKTYISHTHPKMIFSFLRTDESIEGTVEYNAFLYRRRTLERVVNHFKRLMEQLIFNVNIPVSGIEMLTEEEKRQLLVDFNNTKTNYPANKTIDGLFEEQVSRAADTAALTYEGHFLTYGRLNDKADRLAFYLQQQGIKPEEPVALMADNSHNVIVAVLAILKAGGTYLPLNFEYPEKRKKYILADSQTNLLLTNYKQLCPYVSTVIDLDDSVIYQHMTKLQRKHGSDHLAYIMYTSGSTGSPKGVMVKHKNVIRLVKNTDYLKFKRGDSILLTGALEFDASTFEIWGALLNGLPLHLLSKDTLLNHLKLKQALRRNRVTTIWMTSPLFNQMLDLDIEVFAGLKNLLVGGDVLSPAHINRVRQRFPALNVINGYGPTENTTFSTTYSLDRDYNESIPIGKPIANSSAYIVDRNNHLAPIGIEGELVVGGDGAARGYLNNPQLTNDKFLIINDNLKMKNGRDVFQIGFMQPCSHATLHLSPHYPVYRTGDLARWLADGNIEFLGRIDHQVKIRGYRIEPGEIENHLLGIDFIKEALVIDRKDREGEKYLCAYVVTSEEKAGGVIDVVELKRELAVSLPDYMVPAYFVPLGAIPLTPNGKVDRQALPEPGVGDIGTAYAAPRNPREKTIVQIWAEVLKIEKEKIGIDADFFELGGHSLKATILISKLHKAFNVKIPLAEIFKSPTIRELAKYIKKLAEDRFLSINAVEEKEYYELSSAQKRLYVLQQMQLNCTNYNIPQTLPLPGDIDKKKLEETFKKLIRRHESLRTSFALVNEMPVQRIHEFHDVEFEIQYDDIKSVLPRGTSIASFVQPFDLSQAPLMRVGLKVHPTQEGSTKDSCLLMVDMHHIITDGTSMDIFVKEFMAVYAGKELHPLRLQYKDYARWQNSKRQREAIQQQEEYWLNQFGKQGEIPVLNLPVDYPRPVSQSFAGRNLTFELPVRYKQVLNDLASAMGATLYIVLLTITNIFLTKICNQEDIVIGTPIAARRHTDLEKIIGMFVNTLALRNYPITDKTFRHFLTEVKERTLNAFENQEYQFEDLVEKAAVNRDISRNPLFDFMLVLQNMEAQTGEIPAEAKTIHEPTAMPDENENNTSKFDLQLTCMERGEHLVCIFTYCTKLFKPGTIEKFIGFLSRIVTAIGNDIDSKISEIEIISSQEKKQILYKFNDNTGKYPANRTIHELFEEQVESTPDNIAAAGLVEIKPGTYKTNMTYISYCELNKKSNHLAGVLRKKGVLADTIVGIMMERSVEMLVAIFGILKAGGAYLPIDPNYPKERVNYMLADSKVKILVEKDNVFRDLSCSRELFVLSFEQLNFEFVSNFEFRISDLSSLNLAYIIYTSGTTGRPKGVMVDHISAVNLLSAVQKEYPLKQTDAYLFKTSYNFDVSVTELFGWFANGGRLVLMEKHGEKNPGEILDAIERMGITHINFVPSMFNAFVEVLDRQQVNRLSGLRYIFLAGEALLPAAVNKFRQLGTRIRLENIYGPTEGTVYSTKYSLSQWDGSSSIFIGKPMQNIRLYILNKDNYIQPTGVPGELCIGGVGLARGYLSNPELTFERFKRAVISHSSLVISSSKKLSKSTNDQYPMTNDHSSKLSPYSPHSPYLPYSTIYRTGDLARWQPDGNIEFLGRIDQQVKIRGFRIELGEIENVLLKHAHIKEAVVISQGDGKGDKYLCAYTVSDKELAESGLREYLSKYLPGYMIPSYFMQVEKIPLTSSGKIHRSALPEPGIKPGSEYSAPGDEMEMALVGIWSEVLGIEKNVISTKANFFHIGGHSLKATILIAKIHKTLDVKLPLAEVFKTPRIRELCAYIKNREKDKYASIEPIEKRDYYRLSAAQKRLYILQQIELESTAYNMPEVIPLQGDIDRIQLEETFKKLIDHHENFRTSFYMANDEPVQRIHDKVEFEIEYYQVEVKVEDGDTEGTRGLAPLSGEPAARGPQSAADIMSSFIRPFDLSKAPLLRVGLIQPRHTPSTLRGRPSQQGREQQSLLMVDMHHIISDGISHIILKNDFMNFYADKMPSLLRVQYKDFSHWQYREKENIKQQEIYWLREFAGEIPVLNLPIDHIRPSVQGFAGHILSFDIPADCTEKIKTMARESNVTLYMIWLSAFNVLLSRLSGQEDIVVGTPVAGRRHADLEKIIGMLINTLPLRNQPTGEKSFHHFLSEVKTTTLEAFENQEYPFEELVEKVAVNRDISRNPLFDVMFTFQNLEDHDKKRTQTTRDRDNTGKTADGIYENIYTNSKFDMTLTINVQEEDLFLTFTYNIALFKKETIERFTRYFKNIISALATGTGTETKLSQIEIIPGEEKKQLLYDFNRTGVELAGLKHKTIHRLFQEQAELIPDRTAVVGRGREMFTYRFVNEKSYRMGRRISKKGIGPGDLVGIMAEPAIEMMIGIMAILKTGAGYVPLDPGNPRERIEYMMENSEAKLLLTPHRVLESLEGYAGETAAIEIGDTNGTGASGDSQRTDALRPEVDHRQTVYMIYTSGTTGKPKGVIITHRNLVNYAGWFSRQAALTGEDRSILTSSFAFDLGYTSVYPLFLSGGQLHILPRDYYILPANLLDYIRRQRITYLKMTASFWKAVIGETAFTKEACRSLRLLVLGGEPIDVRDVEKTYRVLSHIRIMNHYGPTEATIGCIARFIDPGDLETFIRRPTIGKPIFNTSVIIVDKYLNVLPIGSAGELCVSGAGVGRGYFKREALTSEKFIGNRYMEGDQAEPPYDRVYRTGDRARWLPDPTAPGDYIIEFLGRVDQQVKIRGFRIELGEIENRLLAHPAVKETVVTAPLDETGDKYLCAYIVLNEKKEKLAPPELRQYLSAALPDYMIPSYFVLIDNIPLTPNGKIDHKALPKPGPGIGQGRIAPRYPVEERLAGLWGDVLGIEKHLIGIDSNFFQLGGHSLKATILTTKIHKEFNIKVPLREIFNFPTIRGFSQYIQGAAEDRFTTLQAVEKKGYYPLSSAQKRLYILQQMELTGTTYNMPKFIPLEKVTDLTKIEETFKKMIKHHENFRTSFYMVNDEPVQRIHDEIEFKIEYYQVEVKVEDGDTPLSGEPASRGPRPAADIISSFIRPFDLTQAPLLRVGLIQPRHTPSTLRGRSSQEGRERQSLLMVDMHHIISDGISHIILKDDFMNFYADKMPPLLRIQYKDFSQWQNRKKQYEIIKQQETYWLNIFGRDIPVLNLPTDYPRPVIQSFSGNTLTFAGPANCTAMLKSLARESNATLYMVLLSAFNLLLSRLGGQEDIVVGTPVAGRRHADLEKIIGMFVNTLALRNFPIGEKSFQHFLQEVKTRTLEAFENQEYPFEELVEKTAVNRDASRNPLFDAVFGMENYNEDQGSAPITGESPEESSQPDIYQVAKFDLTLIAVEKGDNLHFNLNYCTKLFKKETIRQLIAYFNKILSTLQNNFEIKIADIVILPEKEKRRILYGFNKREVEYPVDKTIPGLFAQQARQTPDGIAVVGSWQPAVDKFENMHLTYMELNKRANQLAYYLYQRRPGNRENQLVGLMAEKSTEMMVGILGILKAGCGYVPLNPKAPGARILYMLNECSVNLVVTTHSLSESFDFGREILYLEEPGESPPANTHIPEEKPANFAYVIFTSGSTGNPKGVPITHANFSPLLHWGYRHLGINSEHRALQNLSYYFDWSVWEIFITLTTGAGLYTAGDEVLLNPDLCLDFIEINCIDVLHITPTQYQYLVNTGRKTNTLKYLFIGAEKLTYDLAGRGFASVSPRCRVFNMYGPTEAAIISAVLEIERSRYHSYKDLGSVPIGVPVSNLSLYILDRHLNLCPVSILGELYISGAGLAAGYLNDPEKSSCAFIPNRYEEKGTGGRRLYKTGDLARWQPDGEVEFLGRIDHQVKIRGFRIELGEIENRLLTSEMVKEAVVIDRETQGEKYLCAYIVPGKTSAGKDAFEITPVREYLGKELPDYMIPSYFMEIEKIPLNPNGKIDRKALPLPVIHKQDRYTPPRDAIERELVKIWSEVLGRDESHLSQLRTSLGIDNNFFELGGHSLNATIMVAKIHKALHVKVPLAEIFVRPTIGELAEYIKNTIIDRHTSIEPVEKKEYYILSPAQKRQYILQQVDPNSTVYNMPELILLPGKPEMVKLQETLRKLIRRHESLRTSFQMTANEPVQRVHDKVEFEIEYYRGEVKGKPAARDPQPTEALISSFIRPFDLTQAPLLRVGLIQPRHTPSALRGHPSQEGREHQSLLMVDMHHIISDGVSHEILQKEFGTLYRDETLPPLRIQYKDFSQWLNHPGQKEKLKKQEAYWLSQFEGEIPILNLPTDFPRPAIQDFTGGKLEFQLDRAQTGALKAAAFENGASLFMVLSALIQVLLAKLSGQEDIVIGIPVAGRRHAELDNIMGMFVNTLALRNNLIDEKSFIEFLTGVKTRTLEAFENQEYPFEELVEKVEVNRDASRNPLFDVMFALNVLDKPGSPGPGENNLTPTDSSKAFQTNRTAKFDLTIIAVDTGNQLSCSIQYCTALFTQKTIRRFIRYLSQITAGILENKNKPIGRLEIITPAEKREILEVFNKTTAEYPYHKTICRLFAQQAERTPNQVALLGIHETLKKKDNMSHMSHMSYLSHMSYKELHEKSDRLAGLLIEKGVKADTIVGLMMVRSLEMMLGIFAILKAGGAYMPIDPDYPPDRIDYMLQDSGAEILLKDNDFTPEASSHLHLPPAPATSLAYIIYTSGSTGKPKGVMIEHHSVINRLNWMQEAYPLGSNDVILQKTPVVFDVSVWELFWWSFYGAGLCLLGPGQEKDPAAIAAAVQTSKVTTMHFVPSMLNAFLHYLESTPEALHQLKSLKQVFSSGEALGVNQVDRFYRLVNPEGPAKLINLYGPTEATVDVSYFNCPVGKPERVPIGKPIHNTHLYVLDKNLHLQPVGIPGELCISGVGLARGYLNRPQLTAEKFDHDLWDYHDKKSKSFCGGSRGAVFSKSAPLAAGGKKIYKTGDLARWLPDGNIEFLGRMDFQVKVRGFRIEMEEIESVLKLTGNLPIKEAVVTAVSDTSGDTRLRAYIVPDEKSAYTLHRQLLLKEQGLPPGISFYEWPNGMPVYYLNRMETEFMYKEIFEEGGYLKHGITLPPGACIFDIGANIGVFTLYMHRECKDARIYSFEPVPPVYEVLELNTSLYEGDFRVFNHALGAKAGEVEFTYYPHAAFLSGGFADRDQEAVTIKAFLQSREEEKLTEEQYDELLAQRLTTDTYTCRVKTLSRVIEENGIETIDLLKIDVEKAEWEVLEGIKPGHWPRIRQLVIEVHEMHQNRGLLNRVTGLLESKGYRVAVEQVQLLEETRLYNLYAVKPPRLEVEKERKEEKKQVHRWYGIDELTRETVNFLKEKLPDYMVPAYIVPLGRLPLTTSGKLDRKALPDPEIKAGKNYVPPQHHIEKKLVEIWGEVLARDELHASQLHTSIGIDDNFFHLGGHSLKATIMISKIKQEMNVDVPLIEIFKTPSIRHLAGYIQAAERKPGKGTGDSPVLLREGTSPDNHLFFIHDGSGEVEGYVEFCQAMNANLDFNCWGIEADNLKNHAPQNVTIEEIAGKYIKKIKTLQPRGPYFIAGWSIGGTIAFEMARQLEQRKERIDFLVLIDSPPPRRFSKEKPTSFTIESEKIFIKKYLPDEEIEEKLETITDINKIWPYIIDYLESKHFDVEIIKKVIMEYEAHVVPGYHRLSIDELIKYLNLGRTHRRARASYIPRGKINAPVHYFAASESKKIIKKRWNGYCKESIKFYEIKGDHYSIFRRPRVLEFAKIFCQTVNNILT